MITIQGTSNRPQNDLGNCSGVQIAFLAFCIGGMLVSFRVSGFGSVSRAFVSEGFAGFVHTFGPLTLWAYVFVVGDLSLTP